LKFEHVRIWAAVMVGQYHSSYRLLAVVVCACSLVAGDMEGYVKSRQSSKPDFQSGWSDW